MLFIPAVLVAAFYGAIHDQISYSVSPEYYTHFKFIQFGVFWGSLVLLCRREDQWQRFFCVPQGVTHPASYIGGLTGLLAGITIAIVIICNIKFQKMFYLYFLHLQLV